jgi:hypothetical protein
MINYVHIVTPAICLIINILFQLGAFRFFPSVGMLKSIVIGFVSGFIFLLSFEFYVAISIEKTMWESTGLLTTNFIIYASLGYCYFHFINLGETARRIRILRELYDSKNGLSMEEILKRYNDRTIVDKRFNRLLSNGQIIFKDNAYFTGKPLVLWMAKLIVMLKRVMLGKKSEFS